MAAYTYHGFARNRTAAQDPCLQPHLRSLHDTFTESISMSIAYELLLVFGAMKLRASSSDILFPPAAYLTKHSM